MFNSGVRYDTYSSRINSMTKPYVFAVDVMVTGNTMTTTSLGGHTNEQVSAKLAR